MKTKKRQVPLDILSIEKANYSVYVGTCREQIEVTVQKDGKMVHSQWLTFDQFVSLLMRDAR